MGITSLRDRKREQSRIATVRAAWQLFIERGYDNVTVGDICAKAEIAPRTFHRYFASKEDVVAEPVRQMTTIVTEYLSAGAPDGADDRAVMRGAMIRVAEFVVERRELLVALRTVAQQSAHLQVSAVVVRTDSDPNIAALLAARTPAPTRVTGGAGCWSGASPRRSGSGTRTSCPATSPTRCPTSPRSWTPRSPGFRVL